MINEDTLHEQTKLAMNNAIKAFANRRLTDLSNLVAHLQSAAALLEKLPGIFTELQTRKLTCMIDVAWDEVKREKFESYQQAEQMKKQLSNPDPSGSEKSSAD